MEQGGGRSLLVGVTSSEFDTPINNNNHERTRKKLHSKSSASRAALHRTGKLALLAGNKLRQVSSRSSSAVQYQSRCSPLVVNFSHFLSSRNHHHHHVIHKINKTTNEKKYQQAASCYRKMRDTQQDQDCCASIYDEQVLSACPSVSFQLHTEQQQQQQVLTSTPTCSSGARGSAGRTVLLLRALTSPHQKNRTLLLKRLLRAPVALAALFSLALSVSLLVLYAMNFHAYTSAPEAYDLVGMRSERAAGEQLESLTVHTECGSITGSREGPALTFKGIPYASPPARWSRPRPLWLDPHLCNPGGQLRTRLMPLSTPTGEANASRTGRQTSGAGMDQRDHCAQLSPLKGRFSGHEDCLYLDIYSPAQLDQAKKLPVMLYIHGGFLTFGSSGAGQVNWMKARPSGQLASELNVLLVAFNYRLQALGFMSLRAEGGVANLDDYDIAYNHNHNHSKPAGRTELEAGNYGLWDQLCALKWVRRNIELFGGDPNNIVIFGPDSASALPIALLTRNSRTLTFGQSSHSNQPNNHLADDSDENTNLFRAAWLINPTLYYELPNELASQHYQRLFLHPNWSQNSCNPTPAAATLPQSSSNLMTSKQRDTDDDETSRPTHLREEENKQVPQPSSRKLIECLRELSAEQIIRLYLSQDDPSYRLDDQNSLPIHGIFADQFVTVDGELVQDSYPLGSARLRAVSGELVEDSPESPYLSGPKGASSAKSSNYSQELNQQQQQQQQQSDCSTGSEQTTTFPANITYNEKQLPTNEQQTRKALSDYDNCSQVTAAAAAAVAATQNKRPPTKSNEVDLLLGSSSQAVEYWPCPRNLNQWNWDDFKRYVATSLNSFSADTYEQACATYQVPSALKKQTQDSKDTIGKDPKETYLSMVTDIRQTCPINELTDSLRERGHSVRRYIVETARTLVPSLSLSNPSNNSFSSSSYSSFTGMPQFAFHSWDLIAFFGFQFDPHFQASKQDLNFQAQIRDMVKSFVHKTNNGTHKSRPIARGSSSSGNNYSETSTSYTLFTKSATTKQVRGKHKASECKMWRSHLGRSYAWVS